MTREHMAPAHPYREDLGTGIAWTPTTVTRYAGGTVVERVPYQTATPWEFWYGLHFGAAFPRVTHWWFRSIWTGRVRVGMPDPALSQDDALVGWVAFDLIDAPRRPYVVIDGTPVAVLPPYPPGAEEPANLPLRLGLARLIVGVLRAEVEPDRWMTVTSLVPQERLATLFPVTHAAATQVFGGWRLAAGDEPLRTPLRAALCEALGVPRPA